MKKLIFCISMLISVTFSANAQTLLHHWNFNNSTNLTTLLAPNTAVIASASITHNQVTNSEIQITSNTTGQGFEITNPNARNGDVAGAHLRFNNAVGGNLVFALPTTGYKDIVVKYATRRSTQGAFNQIVDYSIDGTNYVNLTTIMPLEANPVLQTLDFSTILAANNNPNFKIKISFTQGGATGTAGNNRFDNFTLEGNSATATDVTAPSVVFTPLNNALNVNITTNPKISFNELIRLVNDSTITNVNVNDLVELRLTDAAGALVGFNATISGSEITLVPNATLINNQKYYLAVKPNVIEDFNNNAITTTQSSVFTTRANQIAFTSNFISVDENAGTVSVNLTLTDPTISSAKLVLKASPFSNTDASDITYATQTLNFTAASALTQTITIPVNNDTLSEMDEYFVLSLEDLNGVTLSGKQFATIYIKDNDRLAPVPTQELTLNYTSSFKPNTVTGSTTEIVVHDAATQKLFMTSAVQDRLDIADFTNPAAISLIKSISMAPYGGITSVAVKNGVVAVACPNANEQLDGSVVFFNTNGDFLKQVTVGALPDMITFSPDGNKIFTANEGQPNTTYSVDPEGSVSIIDISGGITSVDQTKVTTLLLTGFNAQESALIASGVRKTRLSSTLSQDFEPEYVTVSADNTKAWVVMQENNAIAEINLTNNTYTSVWPLGKKDFNVSGSGLDASDNSGKIHISNYPVKSFFMPDGIANYTINGKTYLVTANEGDEKEYGTFVERTTVGAVTLDPTIFPNAAVLKETHNLGRLRISSFNGDTDNDGDYDELMMVGSRSFSIFDADAKNLVYDSKDDMELITSKSLITAAFFNADNEGSTLKNRSRSKGPEPEGVTVATIGGQVYAFVGLERVGGIMVYNITNPANVKFVDYKNNRTTTAATSDLGPEGIIYISAANSPTGKPYVMIANEVSGNISVFEVAGPVVNPFKLQLLHSSDGEGGSNNMANFAAVFEKLESQYPNTIKISSGDNWIPGPFFNASGDRIAIDPTLRSVYNSHFGALTSNSLRTSIGRIDLSVLNLLKYNASALGNHEFDAGTNVVGEVVGYELSGTDKRWAGAQFPFLSANLDFSGDAALAPLYTSQILPSTAYLLRPDTLTSAVPRRKIAPATIVTVNGERIGVVGATTQILESISSVGGVKVKGSKTNNMAELATYLQPFIDQIRATGVNKIILTSHLQQISLEKQLVRLLRGVDIVIAGGSSTLLADANDILRPGDVAVDTYPLISQNADNEPALVVNVDQEWKYVGRLVVDFDAAGVLDINSLNSTVNGVYATTDSMVTALHGSLATAFASGTKAARVKTLVDVVNSVIAAKDGNILGKTSVFLNGRRTDVRTQETNLGNISNDANLAIAKQYDSSVLVGIKNGGGIRTSIGEVRVNPVTGIYEELPPQANPSVGKQAGDISQLDVENALRFNNSLSLVTVTAAQLLQILNHGVAATAPGVTPGQFSQVGGISYSFNASLPAGSRIRNAVIIDSAENVLNIIAKDGIVQGDPARPIRIVTLTFLLTGGDGYPFNTFITANPGFARKVDLVVPGVPKTGNAIFTDNGSEQDAFAEYLKLKFNNAPYNITDVPMPLDRRIQNLAVRQDSVFRLPSVRIVSPIQNTVLDAGTPITLGAVANDANGTISKVEFYSSETLFATDSIAPYEFSSTGIGAGVYLITAKAFDNSGNSTVSDTVKITVTACTPIGNITAEGYFNIPGRFVSNLTGNPAYPNSPSVTTQLNALDYRTVGDNYGARLRGYICAPVTGNYTFYIASNENSELYLSTSDDPTKKRRIAYLNSAVNPRAWFTFFTQKSVQVYLLKGARYYIEALHKESTGADHLSVGWFIPGTTSVNVISGSYLSPVAGIMSTSSLGFTDTGLFTDQSQLNANSADDKSSVFTVYPNPVTANVINVKSNKTDLTEVNVKLFNLNGVLVYQGKSVVTAGNFEVKLNQKPAAGVYILNVDGLGTQQLLFN